MMWSRTHSRQLPVELRDALFAAPAASAELVSAALDVMAARCALPDRASRTQRVRALIAAHAWTDAALAIAAFDHGRAVRRLVYEDGEWHCRIASPWAVPDWLDDSIDFSHSVLPLAILGALIDAPQLVPATARAPASVPRSQTVSAGSIPAVSCDNYI